MTTFDLDLSRPVVHVNVDAGSTVILKGALHSTFDGADVDAATTTWPGSAPGGASVDAGGLVDFDAGGFHLSARDPSTHVVELMATGHEGAGCKAAHVASPCIVLRTLPQARSRLITIDEWTHSLVGRVTVEASSQAIVPEIREALPSPRSTFTVSLGIVMAILAALLAGFMVVRAYQESPRRKLRVLFDRVEAKLSRSDPALAGSLAGPIDNARIAVKKLRVDPRSKDGARIHDALVYIDAKLDDSRAQSTATREREAADTLVADVERALEAAEEANAAAHR